MSVPTPAECCGLPVRPDGRWWNTLAEELEWQRTAIHDPAKAAGLPCPCARCADKHGHAR